MDVMGSTLVGGKGTGLGNGSLKKNEMAFLEAGLDLSLREGKQLSGSLLDGLHPP